MLEWQAESSLFTVRVRGKQWYWVYKFELKTITDILSAPKNIGHNKWFISFFDDLKVADDYLHIMQLRAQTNWVDFYWTSIFERHLKDSNLYATTPQELLISDYKHFSNPQPDNPLPNPQPDNKDMSFFDDKEFSILKDKYKSTSKRLIWLSKTYIFQRHFSKVVLEELHRNLIAINSKNKNRIVQTNIKSLRNLNLSKPTYIDFKNKRINVDFINNFKRPKLFKILKGHLGEYKNFITPLSFKPLRLSFKQFLLKDELRMGIKPKLPYYFLFFKKNNFKLPSARPLKLRYYIYKNYPYFKNVGLINYSFKNDLFAKTFYSRYTSVVKYSRFLNTKKEVLNYFSKNPTTLQKIVSKQSSN
jgi:hypothetical protein